MGCSGSSASAQEPAPPAQSPDSPSSDRNPTLLASGIGGDFLAPGQPAIVLNSPDSWMIGNQVILDKYDANQDMWRIRAGRLGIKRLRSDWLKPAPGKYKGNIGVLVPGMTAIIRNHPEDRLMGKPVLCKKFDADKDKWLVWTKGSKTKDGLMHLGIEFLEPDKRVPLEFDPDYPYEKLVTGQKAIIRGCLIDDLNGKHVVCEEYNADLDEWVVKGAGSSLSKGMSLGSRLLEPVPLL